MAIRHCIITMGNWKYVIVENKPRFLMLLVKAKLNSHVAVFAVLQRAADKGNYFETFNPIKAKTHQGLALTSHWQRFMCMCLSLITITTYPREALDCAKVNQRWISRKPLPTIAQQLQFIWPRTYSTENGSFLQYLTVSYRYSLVCNNLWPFLLFEGTLYFFEQHVFSILPFAVN